MKTFSPKSQDLKQTMYLIDAKDKVVGKLATVIANKLRGKDKAIFSPHIDCGDQIVVINADKIKLSGKKLDDKFYYRHSGYPGGLKQRSAGEMLEKDPTKILELAVKGMLPKNKLRKNFLKKLKLYAGEQHPHSAQNPEKLEV